MRPHRGSVGEELSRQLLRLLRRCGFAAVPAADAYGWADFLTPVIDPT